MSTPARIGRHRILEPVGSGGFATVWRGYDDDLDADVAVKILAENWAGRADIRARFVDEARLLRRADSDRVVRVHDIGTLDDGRPYFVMSYADGGTLADRLTDRALPVDEALRLAEESARAVAVLHDLGVLHRDVKPSNILFRKTAAAERVMIADLGLAKAVATASGITLSAGTPGYMPPEQIGPGGGLDQRVDVYALGALTYQMLTGMLPTSPSSPTDELVPPSHLRKGLPPGTDEVVLRALRRDRTGRFPDAGAYAEALRELRCRPDPTPSTVTDPSPATPPAVQPTLAPGPAGSVQAGPPRAPYRHPPSPFLTQQPPPGGHGRARRPKRSRKRRLVTTGIVLGSILVLLGGGYGALYLWAVQVSTVRSDKGQISIRFPNYMRTGVTHTQTTSLARFAGKGRGLELTTERDPHVIDGQDGITVVVGRELPRTSPAKLVARTPPIKQWLSPGCQAQGVDRPSRNPTLPGVVRVWTSGSCASSTWYGQAALRGPGYSVLIYMKAQVDGPGGKAVFDETVASLRVDARSLPR